MANKDRWGRFAIDIHRFFSQYPGALHRCEMLKIRHQRPNADGRTRMEIDLPGLDWIEKVMEKERENIFPRIENGKKVMLPKYLDLITKHVHKSQLNVYPAMALYCNYFITKAAHDKVQVIVYGFDKIVPFWVPSF